MQILTVAPVVTASTALIPSNTDAIGIGGLGFDPNVANDSITLSNGVTGSVYFASATTLDFTVNGLSSVPAGTALYASVTVDGQTSAFESSGPYSNVQIGTVEAVGPTVTPNTAPIPANADGDGIGIGGSDFDPNAANDTITFDNGVTGSVYSASATSMDFTVNGLSSLTGGTPLFASVTVDGVSSGSPVQILTVAPVVTASTALIPSNTDAIGIGGLGFDPNVANDSITLSNGVTGSVYFASATTLDFTVNGLSSVPAGTALYASVTVDGQTSAFESSGPYSNVQIGTVEGSTGGPTLTPNTAPIPADADGDGIGIGGSGFDPNVANDSIILSNGVTGSVYFASATTLDFTVNGLSSLTGGTPLYASVTVDGVSSGSSVQILTVAPVITANTAPIPGDTTAIGIGGLGFDPNVANDTITLSNGVTGSVYFASATTLDFTVNGLNNVPAGTPLYATVTVDGQSSGAIGGPVQIGTVTGAGVNWIVTDPNGNAGSGSPTDVTLPYAIANAQNGDSITFANDLSGDTIILNSTLIIDHNYTITGLVDPLAVSGNYSVEVFDVLPGVTTSISDLIIENGYASSGGGIHNGGTLTLTGDTLCGNTAYDSGGGISNDHGNLTVSSSTLSGNSTPFGNGSADLQQLWLADSEQLHVLRKLRRGPRRRHLQPWWHGNGEQLNVLQQLRHLWRRHLQRRHQLPWRNDGEQLHFLRQLRIRLRRRHHELWHVDVEQLHALQQLRRRLRRRHLERWLADSDQLHAFRQHCRIRGRRHQCLP